MADLLAVNSTRVSDDEWRPIHRAAEAFLGAKLRRELGRGGFGRVYQYGRGRVAKVTIDAHEVNALEVLSWAAPVLIPAIEQMRSLGHFTMEMYGSREAWIIVREAVRPLSRMQASLKYPGIAYLARNPNADDAEELLMMLDDAESLAASKKEKTFLAELRAFTEEHQAALYDLRPDNMGHARDGRLVIQDPQL